MKTGLSLTLSLPGYKSIDLALVLFSGREYLSRPFHYQVEFACRNEDPQPTVEKVVDKNATVTLLYDDKPQRYFHGVISQFACSGQHGQRTHYTITLVPTVFRLSLRKNSRIFQQVNVQNIVETLLKEMKIEHYEFVLSKPHVTREFCVQYRESDLDFVERLCAEEGITYFSRQEADHETLVFFDDIAQLTPEKTAFIYRPRRGQSVGEPSISHWEERKKIASAVTVLKDYTFKNPVVPLLNQKMATDLSYQRKDYEYFDAYGRYKKDDVGRAFTERQLEQLRRDCDTVIGLSSIALMAVGQRFALAEHPDYSEQDYWLPVEIEHHAKQPQALEEENAETAVGYTNEFYCVPKTVVWQPIARHKPVVDGPEIATVVGPENEEIYCDEFGRVKVQFPWDRYVVKNPENESQRKEEAASCWVRVSQGWASANYGMVAIPRVGSEVIVDFLHGDPDQPIIVGRTYHARNPHPYLLPSHKTRTAIKTKSYQGTGFNELRFEDATSREQIFMHAEKDIDIIIKNIHRESIGVDHHRQIGANDHELVAGNQHRSIGKAVYEEFGQDHHTKIGRNLVQQILGGINRTITNGIISKIGGAVTTMIGASEEKIIGANQRISVNNDSYLKATNIVLEAGSELTIKGPGGFIKIDSSGITISGNVVKINEGGSPGTGTAPQKVEPQLPDAPIKPDDPDAR